MNGNEDADPDESFTAVIEQAQRCEQLLQKIQAANARILARAAAEEAVWQRVAKERYNNACRECAARRDNPGVPDAYLDAISVDTDLKAVCDNRWLLGEAVDVLRSRLDRLDTIAVPYDDLERCIRRSVTAPDRSPAELDGAIEEALRLARDVANWKPAHKDDTTLVDRWTRRLKNNPVVAAIIMVAVALGAIGSFYKEFPSSWTAGIVALFDRTPRATEGWADAGTLDPSDHHRWSRVYVEIDEQSGGSARPYPVRAGDVIKPRIDIPEWIVGYAERGTQDVLIAPKLENYKAPAKNTTGAKYAAGVKYEVVEVSVMPVLGQDDVVWLRLIPR